MARFATHLMMLSVIVIAASLCQAQETVTIPADDPLDAPYRPDPNPIADALSADAEHEGLTAWWLGNAGFAIRIDDKVILTDPVISLANDEHPHLSELGWRKAGPGEWLQPVWQCDQFVGLKYKLPLLARELPRADLVLLSHAHEDHAASKTMHTLARRTDAIFCGPEDLKQKLLDVGAAADRIRLHRPGKTETFDGVEITWTFAHHGPESYACGFLIRYHGYTVFYTGDTSTGDRISDFEDVDLLLLPIPHHYMGGERGAKLANDLDAKFVIPCHYDTYEILAPDAGDQSWLLGDPAELRKHMDHPERLVELFQGQALHIRDGKGEIVRTPNPRMLYDQAWETYDKVTIDGDLTDWQRARWTVRLAPRPGSPQGDSARVATMWDAENLYIAFDVRDADVQATETGTDAPVWNDDCIEVDIDPQRDQTPLFADDDYIFHVSPIGATQDASGSETGKQVESWNSNFRHAEKINGTLNDDSDTDRGYVIEMAIPWSDLGVKPAAGMKIAIDFVVLDRDAGQPPYYFDWAKLVGVQRPSDWGIIELVERWTPRRED